MDIANKTLQLKQDFDDVYNKGCQDGNGEGYVIGKEQGYSEGYSQSESDFWDKVQRNGSRKNYGYAFYYWDAEYIKPKYKVTINSRPIAMFSYNNLLKKVEKEYFDLSGYTPDISSSSSNCNYNIFSNCTKLEEIEDIRIKGGGYYFTYAYCGELHTIEVMRCIVNGTYSGVFSQCYKLRNITIEGEIGNNFDIHYSPLSTASIVSIIEHLSDTSGATLTLNTTAKNNMVFPYTSPYTNVTYNSWDELIATKTNWTIATSS